MQKTQYCFGLKRVWCILLIIIVSPAATLEAQQLSQNLQKAFQQFMKDPQLSYGISSLYVIDANSGAIVFDYNSGTGLAPASTQKLITSVTALALLGRDFRYATTFSTDSQHNMLYISTSGDPTLGSERWEYTKPELVLNRITRALKQNAARVGAITIDKYRWAQDAIPDGWVWQDIGNYYGAGSENLNWRENQYDLILQSGHHTGDTVKIVGTNPRLHGFRLQSEVVAAPAGTGDNAYIYFNPNGGTGTVKGTIPVNENAFVISGAFPSGYHQFYAELSEHLIKNGISDTTPELIPVQEFPKRSFLAVHQETSPPLDSILFWFNKKSINLYGEALLKTIAFEQRGYGTPDTGIAVIQDFWKTKGVDRNELNLVDGSGLSPLNRVTTHAQVSILRYAYQQPWFPVFLQTLPIYNGMTMKSGTIRNVKGFAGYHTRANGRTYIFSFLVNNYNGLPSALVRKMYSVLDQLK